MNSSKRTKFLLYYYLIGFFGLYFLLYAGVFRFCSPGSVDLLPGQIDFFPHTRQTILFYIMLVPVLFFYFLHALYAMKKKSSETVDIYKPARRLVVFLFLNGIVIFGAQFLQINLFLLSALWLISFFGIRHCWNRRGGSNCDQLSSSTKVSRQRYFAFVSTMMNRFEGCRISQEEQVAMLFLIALCGGLIWAFSPFVFSTPKLLNDFLDIPETTFMNTSTGVVTVDNFAFIKKFNLCGDSFSPGCLEEQQESPDLQSRISASLNVSEFAKKNQPEITWKILTRGFIHHHNHVLAPVNDLALGRPLHKVFSQYGWGWVYFMKFAMEHLPGGICYGNYIRLHFFTYYFYYALFLWLLFYLFKDVRIVAILFSISVISVLKMGPYAWLGPGASPIRHFFDIPVIFFFMQYLSSRYSRHLYTTLLFCILGVAFNTQFGTILFLCVLAGLTFLLFWPGYTEIADKKRLIPALIVGGIGLFGSVWFCSHLGAKDVVSGYFFNGVLGFPIKEQKLVLLTVGILAGYLAWICIPKNVPVANRIMSIFLLWYVQLMLLYYVRGAVYYMLLPILPLIGLAVGYLVVLVTGRPEQDATGRHRVIFLVSVSLLAYVFGSETESYRKKFRKEFVRNFTQHQTYHWDMPRTHFISTMNPCYFEGSIKLIQKYSQDNGIYMISKYDRFLPFIAGRYSAMPFLDLEWYLITQKELDLTIRCLEQERPTYLFVDTDIDRDWMATEVTSPGSRYWGFREESLWRAQRLRNLKTVFDAVRDDYEKVESTELLTIYHRKALLTNGKEGLNVGK